MVRWERCGERGEEVGVLTFSMIFGHHAFALRPRTRQRAPIRLRTMISSSIIAAIISTSEL